MFIYHSEGVKIVVKPDKDCDGWIIQGETTSITEKEKLICEQYEGKKRLFEICYYLYWHMVELGIPESIRQIICFPLENAEIVEGSGYRDFMATIEKMVEEDKKELEKNLSAMPIIIEEKAHPEDGQFLLF